MKENAPYLLCLSVIILLLSGCPSVTEEQPPTIPATLIYMAADNNLDYYAMLNIKQMERGVSENAAGLVYVFLTRRVSAQPSHPYLLKITRNTEDSIVRSPIIRTYPQQNTSNPDFLRQVIADVKEQCKTHNAELCRLVLWSHGTGWLPEGTPFNDSGDEEDDDKASKDVTETALFTFGLDETGYGDGTKYPREMDIKDLATALKDERFELLIMDACFMGAVEVAYELRNISEWFIMSPSEIAASGLPYEDIIDYFTAPIIEPLAIAVKFFNYYYRLKGSLQTAAVSVIKTCYLDDLARGMETIYQDYKLYDSDISIGDFLQYDRTASNYFFDFKNFITRVAEQSNNDYTQILTIYRNALPYYLHTPQIYGMLDLTGTSGLSIYIPNTFIKRGELHEYYQSLSWTKDSNALLLFN